MHIGIQVIHLPTSQQICGLHKACHWLSVPLWSFMRRRRQSSLVLQQVGAAAALLQCKEKHFPYLWQHSSGPNVSTSICTTCGGEQPWRGTTCPRTGLGSGITTKSQPRLLLPACPQFCLLPHPEMPPIHHKVTSVSANKFCSTTAAKYREKTHCMRCKIKIK